MKKEFNDHLITRINDYMHLQVGEHTLPAPYFINNPGMIFGKIISEVGLPDEKIREIKDLYKSRKYMYGWYSGKGTPEQLVESAFEILKLFRLESINCTPQGIVELMRNFGIGVDCSGMVYEVLRYASEKISEEEKFKNSLAWRDIEKMTPSRAGTFIFADDASVEVSPSDITTGDLILSIDVDRTYDHVGVFFHEGDRLLLAHSTLQAIPVGMRVQEVDIQGDTIVDFGIDPIFGNRWEKLLSDGRLILRRLKYFVA